MIFTIQLRGQQILLPDPPPILAAGSSEIVHFRLDRDEEWTGLSITMSFRIVHQLGSDSRRVLVTDPDEAYDVPPETLQAGWLYIGATGVANGGAKRNVTAVMRRPLEIYPSEDAASEPSGGITPSLADQILGVIGVLSNLDTKDKSSIVAAINSILRDNIGDLDKLQTAVKTNLVAAINYLRQTAVFRVNNILPDQEHGNVTLKPKDISVEIPGTSFNNTLQVLLNALYAGAEQNVTEQYERWSSSGELGGVLEFFLSEAIADPGCYVVYTSGKTWRMRYIVARTDAESTDWRWVESYSEDGFFMLSLYAGQDKVLVIDSDGGDYKIDGDDLTFRADLQQYDDQIERLQKSVAKDVTSEYEAWLVGHPMGTVQEFLWTMPDGAYRLDSSGGSTYLQRISTADETFRWIVAYSDVCEVSLYQGSTCLLSYSGGSTMEFRGKPLATEEFVKEQIATLEARIEALEGGR